MPKHRGRFKWRKYSRHRGNLSAYWTHPFREPEHLKPDYCNRCGIPHRDKCKRENG